MRYGWIVAPALLLGAADVEVTTDPLTPDEVRRGPLAPLGKANDIDVPLAKRGRKLFFTPALSARGRSCASCHPIEGANAPGAAGEYEVPVVERDAVRWRYVGVPTIWNAPRHFRQKWDGADEIIEHVSKRPIGSPSLMADGDVDEIDTKQKLDAALEKNLRRAVERVKEKWREHGFEDPGDVTAQSIVEALAEYIRAIEPRDSQFDRFVERGEALPEQAQQGYRKFVSYGCASCHQGRGVGGNLMAKFGAVLPRNKCTPDDAEHADCWHDGYRNVDKSGENVFRVPSLRNVALTTPYFHDGTGRDTSCEDAQAACTPSCHGQEQCNDRCDREYSECHERHTARDDLKQAVRIMAKHQLGREVMPDDDVKQIVAFLETLTGTPDKELVE